LHEKREKERKRERGRKKEREKRREAKKKRRLSGWLGGAVGPTRKFGAFFWAYS
jgi:hypothetical protein